MDYRPKASYQKMPYSCCSSGKVPRFMSRFIVFTPGRGGGDVLIAPVLFYD